MAAQEIYEFGRFRLLAGERVLARDGQPLPLTPKAFDVLLMLVENHGHVVQKDSLMQRIWPDVFVQEDNITYNISMLRRALDDGANGERYIETVPRRGYRFIAPVRIGTEEGEDEGRNHIPLPAKSSKSPSLAVEPGAGIAPKPVEGPPALKALAPMGPQRRWQVRMWTALAAVTIAVFSGLVFFIRKQGTHRLIAQDTVVLADFTNSTGEAVFDETLKHALQTNLDQSPFLSVLSDQQVSQELGFMGMKQDVRLTPEVAREVCQRAGSSAMLLGSIAKLGEHYAVGLDALDCQSGRSLGSELVEADSRERVLRSLGDAATKMRAKLGESLSTIQEHDKPVEDVTTASLEALQAYSRGMDTLNDGNDEGSVPLFQHAVSLDPNFAMAYAALGSSYDDLGESELAAENARRAYEMRERTSEREKLSIESHYYEFVTGDLEKGRQTCTLWAETYPRDGVARNELGAIYANLGQYENDLDQLRDALRIDPASRESYANLAVAYLYLNRLGEANATINAAETKNLDSDRLHEYAYVLAFLQDDTAGMAKQVAWSKGKPGVEDVLLAFEADTAAYLGRLGMARRFSDEAVASAEQARENETAAGYEADAAIREVLFGNALAARQRAIAALKLSTNRDVQFGAAMALAFAGDTGNARRLADDLARRFPEDTIVQSNYLPTLHGQLAIVHNDTRMAIEALQAAAPYELGTPNGGAFTPTLYPVYARGEAFLAAGKGPESAVEFEKILAERGVATNEPIGALAHLGLARAYALQGDTAKSRSAYQEFLTLWKNADLEIPILRTAKVEYASLK